MGFAPIKRLLLCAFQLNTSHSCCRLGEAVHLSGLLLFLAGRGARRHKHGHWCATWGKQRQSWTHFRFLGPVAWGSWWVSPSKDCRGWLNSSVAWGGPVRSGCPGPLWVDKRSCTTWIGARFWEKCMPGLGPEAFLMCLDYPASALHVLYCHVRCRSQCLLSFL